jgi:hypothetical protein
MWYNNAYYFLSVSQHFLTLFELVNSYRLAVDLLIVVYTCVKLSVRMNLFFLCVLSFTYTRQVGI